MGSGKNFLLTSKELEAFLPVSCPIQDIDLELKKGKVLRFHNKSILQVSVHHLCVVILQI